MLSPAPSFAPATQVINEDEKFDDEDDENDEKTKSIYSAKRGVRRPGQGSDSDD